jgi:hypothetical protein
MKHTLPELIEAIRDARVYMDEGNALRITYFGSDEDAGGNYIPTHYTIELADQYSWSASTIDETLDQFIDAVEALP